MSGGGGGGPVVAADIIIVVVVVVVVWPLRGARGGDDRVVVEGEGVVIISLESKLERARGGGAEITRLSAFRWTRAGGWEGVSLVRSDRNLPSAFSALRVRVRRSHVG